MDRDSCIIWQEILTGTLIEVGAGKERSVESSACAGSKRQKHGGISCTGQRTFPQKKYITKDRWRMRHEVLFSWNVNGNPCLREKGICGMYFQELDADVFCIQESKLQGGAAGAGYAGVPSVLELRCKRKGIQEQQYLQKKNRLVYLMALGLRSMTKKAE